MEYGQKGAARVIKSVRTESRRKFLQPVLSAVLFTILLTGCSSVPSTYKVSESSLYLSKDGKVTAFLVEPFDKEYYSEAELEEMIREEVRAYNKRAGFSEEDKDAPVQVKEISLVNTQGGVLVKGEENQGQMFVAVRIEYVSADVYAEFNERELFYGTVAEAYKKGYKITVPMIAAGDYEASLSESQLREMEEKHILIMEENMRAFVPSKILFFSSGMTLLEEKSAKNQEETGYSYMIMK